MVDLFFRPGEWLLSKFMRLDMVERPILWIVGLFFVQAAPATLIRASNLEEGRIIALARGAVDNGYWLVPHVYGERFVERPVLLSWITALCGEIFGFVGLWALRIPHLCFFLVGVLLIYQLLRSCTGKSAAIFGALCWITMPMVAAKFINAEPDIALSVLMFGAFCAWWQGTTPARWFAVALLLCLAGLTKGPQPIAYFIFGVFPYLLLKQRDQLPAFLLTNLVVGAVIGAWYLLIYDPTAGDESLWLDHSRVLTLTGGAWFRDHIDFVKSIAIESLPGTLLIGPAVMTLFRHWRDKTSGLLLAVVLYTLSCTIVLVVWPGGVASRYVMPGTMGLAIVCGLMFEAFASRRAIAGTFFVSLLIFCGLLIRGWIVMPIWPHLFQGSKISGQFIAAHLRGPLLYVVGGTTELNMLVYVQGRIKAVRLNDLAGLTGDAVLLPDEIAELSRKTPDLRVGDIIPAQKQPYRMVELGSR